MSKWTHIAGLVRVDRLPLNQWRFSLNNLKALFTRDIPQGSEGPLLIAVMEGEFDQNAIMWANVIVYGDLRDFGDEHDVACVIRWFKESCERILKTKQGTFYRQAILNISVEGGPDIVLWDKEDEEWHIEQREYK